MFLFSSIVPGTANSMVATERNETGFLPVQDTGKGHVWEKKKNTKNTWIQRVISIEYNANRDKGLAPSK